MSGNERERERVVDYVQLRVLLRESHVGLLLHGKVDRNAQDHLRDHQHGIERLVGLERKSKVLKGDRRLSYTQACVCVCVHVFDVSRATCSSRTHTRVRTSV